MAHALDDVVDVRNPLPALQRRAVLTDVTREQRAVWRAQAAAVRAQLDPNLLVSARRGEKSIRNSFHTRRVNQNRRWTDAAMEDEPQAEPDDRGDLDGGGDDADDDDDGGRVSRGRGGACRRGRTPLPASSVFLPRGGV